MHADPKQSHIHQEIEREGTRGPQRGSYTLRRTRALPRPKKQTQMPQLQRCGPRRGRLSLTCPTKRPKDSRVIFLGDLARSG
eukprot:795745-Pyramimonas_sp.AAC.1